MKNKLEQLLNSLIEKGWKPFGKGWLNLRKLSWIHKWWLLLHEPSTRVADNYSLRDLVSKSSWLWQFVCENKLFPKNRWHKRENDLWCGVKFYEDEPEYYIIECALLEEWELEDFLLNSIKIWNED